MIAASILVGAGETHRYLDRTLRLAATWADWLLIYADQPDPDTLAACAQWGSVRHATRDGDFNEATARNAQLDWLDEQLTPGDIIVVLDADEELQATDGSPPRDTLQAISADTTHDAWLAVFHHLWTPDGSAYRVDGAWAPAGGHRIYRHEPGHRVHITRALGCPPVPHRPWNIDPQPRLRMLHWGYARPHDVTAKHAYYMAKDGGRFHALTHLESIVAEPTLQALS